MALRPLLLPLCLGLAACGDGPGPVPSPQMAHTLVYNGTIYTNDETTPVVQALALDRGGRVMGMLEVEADLQTTISALSYILVDEPLVIDLEGAYAYPGFIDSHMHLRGVGERELTLNLEGSASLDELLARVAERVAVAEAGEWVVGRGWIETHWDPPVFPTRQQLDAVAPDHPVVLRRSDGHALVANSRALAAGGVNATREDPFGGAILRDADGEPTGMLVDNAMALVTRMIPGSAGIPLERAYRAGIARSLRMGWTTVQIAGDDLDGARQLRALCEADALPLRVVVALEPSAEELDAALNYIDWMSGGGICIPSGRLEAGGLKVSVDGALGSRGAALLEPYADHESAGFLTWTDEDYGALLERALREGVQVQTHAIGDAANRWVLDHYAAAFAAVPEGERGRAEPRWRIEHAQHLTPEDLPRFAELGVIPSMQASHAIGDLHFAPRRLGPERLATAYAWRSLIDGGNLIAGGTDAPVEAGDPRIEFYAAVARADLAGFQGEGWHPEQAMTRREALLSLTAWPAYAAFREDELGCLTVGCRADITVLGGDLMSMPLAEIPAVPIIATIVDGELVYADPEHDSQSASP